VPNGTYSLTNVSGKLMLGTAFRVKLRWIMEGRWVSVKFDAGRLCPKCNRQGGIIKLQQVLRGVSRPGLKARAYQPG
jgi:hypothetical protein